MVYKKLLKAVDENDIKEVSDLLQCNDSEIRYIIGRINSCYLFYKVRSKEMFILLFYYFRNNNFFDIFYILNSIINCAIMNGMDIEIIKWLVDRGGSINSHSVQGDSPLLTSIRSNRSLSFIEGIIKIGANVNEICDYKGNTMLHLAVSDLSADLETVKLLLNYGADINAENNNQYTVFMKGLSTADESVLIELIDHGSNVSKYEKLYCSSSLTRALYEKKRSKEFICRLIAEGASLNNEYRYNTPLILLIKNNYSIDFITDLIQLGADVNYRPSYEGCKAPLLQALSNKKNKDIISILIDNGADVNVEYIGYKYDLRITPLMSAITNGFDVDIIDKLINKGAKINKPDHFGITPLMHAIKHNDKNIIQSIINSGADVNVKDSVGFTPLFYSVIYNGDQEIIKLLIDNGADFSTINECHNQIWFNIEVTNKSDKEVDFIELIINKNNINVVDEKGRTFLMYAIELNMISNIIINIINCSGCNINAVDMYEHSALFYAIDSGCDLDVFVKLIESGANVNFSNKYGFNTLTYASQTTHYKDLIRILVNYGADINYGEKNGRTVLSDILYRWKDKELVDFLIEKGANVKTQSDDGYTPLMHAINHIEGPSVDIISLLLKSGADVKVVTLSGYAAFYFVLRKEGNDSIKIAYLLSDYGASFLDTVMNLVFRQHNHYDSIDRVYNTEMVAVVIELLSCKEDINAVCKDRLTFLRFYHALILHFQYYQLGLMLMFDHINVWKNDIDYMNELLCHIENVELIETIISYGANINYIDYEGKTPLIHAVINNKGSKFIKLILENGGNCNYINLDLNSAIHFANSEEIINVLILFGRLDVTTINIFNKKQKKHLKDSNISNWEAILKHIAIRYSVGKVKDDHFYKKFYGLINKYCQELDAMKCKDLINNLSFYKFCGNLSVFEKQSISESEFCFNYKEIKELFPNYSNIIIMKLKKFQFYLKKRFLSINLEKLILLNKFHISDDYGKNCTDANNDIKADDLSGNVVLYYDILYCISKYLSHRSIANLFIASLLSQ